MTSPETYPAKIPRDKLSNMLCDGGSTLRWTHLREAIECTLGLTAFNLLESFVHLLYSLRCFACKWLIKLDVPPPSASCWVQRRHFTRFTSLPLTFVTVGGSKNSQMGLVGFLYTMALYLHIAVFHMCLAPSAALFPDQIRKWVWERD